MRWEYRPVLVTGTHRDVAAMLNEWGAEGWELVAVQGAMAYFKRAKEEPAKPAAPAPPVVNIGKRR